MKKLLIYIFFFSILLSNNIHAAAPENIDYCTYVYNPGVTLALRNSTTNQKDLVQLCDPNYSNYNAASDPCLQIINTCTGSGDLQNLNISQLPNILTKCPNGIDLSAANNLQGAYLPNIKIKNNVSTPTNLNLTGACLSNADLSGVNLTGSTLSNANLSGANLTNSILDGAALNNAILTGTNFLKATFTSLIESQNSGSNRELANIGTSTINSTTNFESAIMDGLDLSNANLSGCNLKFASLQYTTLNNTNLTAAHLDSANLNGATIINNSNFTSANLTDVTLSSMTNSGGATTFVTINDSNFTSANLDGTKMRNISINNSNFSNSNFANSILTASNITSAVFDDSTLDSSTFIVNTITKSSFNDIKTLDFNIYVVNYAASNGNTSNVSLPSNLVTSLSVPLDLVLNHNTSTGEEVFGYNEFNVLPETSQFSYADYLISSATIPSVSIPNQTGLTSICTYVNDITNAYSAAGSCNATMTGFKPTINTCGTLATSTSGLSLPGGGNYSNFSCIYYGIPMTGVFNRSEEACSFPQEFGGCYVPPTPNPEIVSFLLGHSPNNAPINVTPTPTHIISCPFCE